MAIQNDNTFVTKGDLKELYTDKIAPYLGGGINYYHIDRTGEELKHAHGIISTAWTAVANTNIPYVKEFGSILQPNDGLFTIPNGMTIEVIAVISQNPRGDSVYKIYNNTDGAFINGQLINPYIGDQYYNACLIMAQWKNDTGHNVDISIRCVDIGSSGSKVSADQSSMTVKEIGRIVDPVKYVSNNSDLQETPVGNIISYMGNSVPKHYLACDGTEYSIGTYPELEAFIIDEFGSINYFGGDGSSTWAVPDLRGEFLRGTGTNSHTNQGNGANVGEHQDATEVGTNPYSANALHCTLPVDDSGTATLNADSKIQTNKYKEINANTSTWSSLSYGLSTVRPTNTSVKYCIKYESTYHAFFSNAAYKVSVAANVGSGAELITFDLTDIIGDSALVANNNTLIAPIDGWYSLGMNWTQDGAENQYYYIRINNIPSGWDNRIGYTNTLYLNKNDVVTIKKQTGASNSGRINFCLLTSNYNPTIVSADSVYSENEQMIGYWKDGKPLYQKTGTITSGITIYGATTLISNFVSTYKASELINSFGTVAYNNGAQGSFDAIGDGTMSVYIEANTGHLKVYTPNTSAQISQIAYTIQYTKTTDTASSLQVENSLLLNRPDLWTVGTEYHFGGGLYGQRFTGNLSTTTTTAWATIDSSSHWKNTTFKIFGIGGTIIRTGSGNAHAPFPYNDGTGLYQPFFGDSSGSKFMIQHKDSSTSTNPYDVWVTYTK